MAVPCQFAWYDMLELDEAEDARTHLPDKFGYDLELDDGAPTLPQQMSQTTMPYHEYDAALATDASFASPHGTNDISEVAYICARECLEEERAPQPDEGIFYTDYIAACLLAYFGKQQLTVFTQVQVRYMTVSVTWKDCAMKVQVYSLPDAFALEFRKLAGEEVSFQQIVGEALAHLTECRFCLFRLHNRASVE